MGKRIEELLGQQGLDTPITGPQAEDVRQTTWYQFVAEIDELTEDDTYTFALDTLDGIRETVTRTKRVSEAQRLAVENIRHGGERGRSRRYEGWQRGRR